MVNLKNLENLVRRVAALVLAAGSLVLAGCAADVLYASGQSYQKRECEKIIDTLERNRCMERVTVSQSEYNKKVEALKSTP